jgi:hypothetical protein
MRNFCKSILALSMVAAPLLAGALRLEVGSPATNQEALAQHAMLVAWTAACHSPEKTSVMATAEGVVNGIRKSIPLKVISLSAPGSFAVTREWPTEGTGAIKMVATNPEYKDYATSAVVPIQNNAAQTEAAKRYNHAPTEIELSLSLH